MTDAHVVSADHGSDAELERTIINKSCKNKDAQLTEGMIKEMKYVELKAEAKKLRLSTSGTKDTLRKRLLAHIKEQRTRRKDAGKGDEETDKETDGETDEETDEDTDAETDDESEEECEKRTKRVSPSPFSIRDVEGSIPEFSGDDSVPVKKWIAKFEDMAELLRWNDLQKLIYGKRMLRGSAKRFMESEKGITSWAAFRKKLIGEFKETISSTTVHAQLARRKKQSDETGRQYVYVMKEIAALGKVEERALMDHIINGVVDDEVNKTILYQSRSLKDLKRNIEIYDVMMEKSKATKKPSRNDYGGKRERRTDPTKTKKSHCFSCGSPDHGIKECPMLGKGAGNGDIRLIGVFEDKVSVDDVVCPIKIHIVPTDVIPYECILGKNFLSNVEVTIRKGKVMKMCSITEDEGKGEIKNHAEREEDTRSAEGENAGAVLIEEAVKGVFNITIHELDVKPQFAREIEQLVKDYKPAKQVKTSIETQIRLHDDIPVVSRPRRLAPREKEILNKQITQWLEEGVVRTSKSEWASPVVIVPKKDGTSRICIDYRALNRKISRDHFPMPLIEDCIDDLVNMKVFSVIDLKNGFLHVPVEESSKKYTSFVTPDGQFEFNKTPFGLCSSPASFVRFVADIFKELIRRKVVFTYVDDVIVPGTDDLDSLSKLKITLAVATENGLQINWHKCQFLKRSVDFLGFTIEEGKVTPGQSKGVAIERFPTPRNGKEIQRFSGVTGFFRKFVKDYARISQPLTDLIRKDARFVWTDECECAFTILKDILISKPVLRIFDPTDCDAFTKTMSKKNLSAKVARWALWLQDYDFTVEPRRGDRLKHVDALSRAQILSITNTFAILVKEKQLTDEKIRAIRTIAEKRPYEEYTIENDLLVKGKGDKVQRCLNSTYQRSIGRTPFEILFGVKMKQKEDVAVKTAIEEEAIQLFEEGRDKIKAMAKENLRSIQEENRRQYNRRCRKATRYKEGDVVFIKRTQFGPAMKLYRPEEESQSSGTEDSQNGRV